ncbi:MAG: cytochrome c5 family protein [Gammaproteobacteria bacterium]|nr:cytochrome c5 family protein [Gammaproteobacteria bacterium]
MKYISYLKYTHATDLVATLHGIPIFYQACGEAIMKKVTGTLIAGILLSVSGSVFAADGQQIYQASCQACHATGAAGAPKLGDKEAWAPRIATGMDALLSSAINGKNAMPPKGACMSCSDEDLKAAIEYMVSQSQ